LAIRTGQRLGSYEILSAIGAGGMGEVYRAHDSRLGRDVALKVLPEIFAADSDRVVRFQREARVLAALNHPNIGAIYGLEEFGSNCALVMELVPGETLAERIDRFGSLSVQETLGIAAQIADALEAAHNSDIIHRDLKPANIKVTPEGRVKVLDFGLAKPNAERSAQDLNQGVTVSSTSQPTQAGRVLGTPAYMSPEQAQGAVVDKRSDVFSFGAVLYEMLAGRRAFVGGSTLEVLSAVLRDNPAPLKVAAPVASIVRRCLEKDPARRFQSMAEVRAALQQITASSEGSRKVRPSRRVVALMIGAVCLVAAAAFVVIRKAGSPAQLTTYQPVQLTALGYVNNAVISPDGNRLAFEWAGPGVPSVEHLALHVKKIGEETIQRVTEFQPGLVVPAWSPDGSQLAFHRLAKDGSGGISIVSSEGGPEKKLYSTHVTFGRSMALAWSPDGKSIAFANAPFSGGHLALNLLSIDTQEVRQIEHNDRCLDEAGPIFSHDGKYLAYNCFPASSDFAIAIVRSDGSGSRILKEFKGSCNGMAWTVDNKHLLFSQYQNGGDGDHLRELTIADGSVRDIASGTGFDAISLSAKGDRLVFAEESGGNDVIWRLNLAQLQDAPVELISSTRTQNGPNYSADGSHIVFSSDRTGSQEIWMSDADGQNLVQLTHLGLGAGSPSWSPDGQTIAFDLHVASKDGSSHADVYTLDLARRIPKKLDVGAGEASVPTWSHDGKWIYFVSGAEGRNRIFRVGRDGGQALAVSTSSGFLPKESVDGQYLYFASSGGSTTLLRASLNPIGTESRVEGIPALSFLDNWTVVREGVYFYPADDISTLSFFDFANKKLRPILKGDTAYFGIAASPDERYLLYARHSVPKRDIMLIDNFR
jgi:Tol biopolymer transport system component/tRNA A-37 threonylcarbamoyl transferase component Bud32